MSKPLQRHADCTALDPPGTTDKGRRWRCNDCGAVGTGAHLLGPTPTVGCTVTYPGAPTPQEQLAAWVRGNKSICPNTQGECLPDFSCCHPRLRWPSHQREQFLRSDQNDRERMMLGSLQAITGAKVHIAGRKA